MQNECKICTWHEKFAENAHLLLLFCWSGAEMLWDADVTLFCCAFYTVSNVTCCTTPVILGQNETGQKHWPHLSGRVKMKQDIFFFGCPNSGIPQGSSCQWKVCGCLTDTVGGSLQHRCNCFSYHLSMISVICLFFKQSFNLLFY